MDSKTRLIADGCLLRNAENGELVTVLMSSPGDGHDKDSIEAFAKVLVNRWNGGVDDLRWGIPDKDEEHLDITMY